MDLYFAPLACSMATRIALYEAGAEANFIQVDQKAKRAADEDFWAVNPMGQVPVLRTDEGRLVTENVAVLSHIAARFPALGDQDRDGLLQWLAFTSTELHKAIFIPLLVRETPDEVKAHARQNAGRPLGVLSSHLEKNDTLLGSFSVADAYLVTVLHWAHFAKVLDLASWPVLAAYLDRHFQRPAIARALSEEVALFKEEQKRRAA